MNGSLSMPTISSNRNFSDVSRTNKSFHGIPPLPQKRRPLRTFVKAKKVNTTEIPALKEEHCHDKDVLQSAETDVLEEQRDSLRLSEIELKTVSLNKQDYNGYLTPGDPQIYTDSSLPDIQSCTTLDSTRRFQAREAPILRLDSGLGDGESLQGSGSVKYNRSPLVSSTTSLPSSPLFTQYEQPYEDIDHYNRIHDQQYYDRLHQQHERNGTDRILANRSKSAPNNLRPLPQMNISGVTCTDSDDFDRSSRMMIGVSGSLQESQNTYMQFNTNKHLVASEKSTRSGRDTCLLVMTLLIVFIISLAALIISIYDLMSDGKQNLQNGNQTILDMQQKLDDLIKENEALAMQNKYMTTYLEESMAQVTSQLQNFSTTINLMNDKFAVEIANITLKPGPQGPPGAANFSLCINKFITMTSPSSAKDDTTTSLLPSLIDIQNYFVTFAYCTYTGATDANLEAQLDDSSNRYRYRCKCWGQVSGINQTLCTLSLWMCPQDN